MLGEGGGVLGEGGGGEGEGGGGEGEGGGEGDGGGGEVVATKFPIQFQAPWLLSITT